MLSLREKQSSAVSFGVSSGGSDVGSCRVGVVLLAVAGASAPLATTVRARRRQPVALLLHARLYALRAAFGLCRLLRAYTRKPAEPPMSPAIVWCSTDRRWQDLVEVNQVVNRTVKPVSDFDLYGTTEYWTLPQASGDCEDYVLLKQRLLSSAAGRWAARLSPLSATRPVRVTRY